MNIGNANNDVNSPTPIAAGTTWRDCIPVDPLASDMPASSPEEFADIVADVREAGICNEITIYRDAEGRGSILDGCLRLDAAEAAGLPVIKDGALNLDEVPHRYVEGNVNREKYIRRQNLLRRHLNSEQKRTVIAKLLKAQPEQSDRSIARQAGVDNKTVASERVRLEVREEIPHAETHQDKAGRHQPAHKVRAANKSPSDSPKGTGTRKKTAGKTKVDDPRTPAATDAAADDPLFIKKGKYEIEASPWFALKMKPIFEGSIKNDPAKSASALSEFRKACAALLPQMTIEDSHVAGNILSAMSDVERDVENAVWDAKKAKANAKRVAWETKHPDEAKEKARAKAQADRMEYDKDDAKTEARENGETWTDIKDEWIENWLANNWSEQAETDFESKFQEQWQKDHGRPWASGTEAAASPPPLTSNQAPPPIETPADDDLDIRKQPWNKRTANPALPPGE